MLGSPFLLAVLGALVSTVSAKDKICSSYSINGTHASQFEFYRFYDFQYSNVTDTTPTASNWPKNRTLDESLVQRKTFSDKSWVEEWSIREAYKQPANERLDALHYIPYNVFMGEKEGKGFLALNTSRLQNNTQLGGEIFFRPADVDAVSLRVSARVYGDVGAVAGFFTYFNDTQECDIEVLTRDDGSRVHFTNQPTLDKEDNEIPGTTFNKSIPFGQNFSDWNVYRLDWLPQIGLSAWFVDGQLLQESTTNVPVVSSTILIDMWSNAGFWSGKMPVWGEAVLEIQWIEMLFNASTLTAQDVPENGVVCPVDFVETNKEEYAGFNMTEPDSGAFKHGFGCGAWVMALMAAWIVAFGF